MIFINVIVPAYLNVIIAIFVGILIFPNIVIVANFEIIGSIILTMLFGTCILLLLIQKLLIHYLEQIVIGFSFVAVVKRQFCYSRNFFYDISIRISKSLSKRYKVSNKIVTFSQFKPPILVRACLSVPAIMSFISDSVQLGKFFKADSKHNKQ